MKWTNVIIVSNDHNKVIQLKFPNYLIVTLFLLLAICSYVLGYFVQDYFHLKYLDKNYNQIVSENRQLRGEGKVILQHIEELKHSLIGLKTFSEKMKGLLSINVKI